MRKVRVAVFSLACILLLAGSSFALSIYVDAAPNVYGSPNYASWQTAAFAAAADGTFTNMSNGVNSCNIGTTDFEIQDEVVYSFGDLGKRLSWIYWIPNETLASLGNDRFQVSLFNTWGSDPAEDFYQTYDGSTWLTPTKWVDYDSDNDGDTDGVIGVAGMAWWGAYGVDTPEALAADIADWGSVSESLVFTAKLDGVETSITSNRDAAPVPEPSTILLMGIGLLGLVGYSRKRSKKS